MSQPFLQHNEASWDRGARLVAGFALIGLGYFLHSWILGIAALIPLATAVIGSCPAYTLLGVRTVRRDQPPGDGSSR